MRDSVAIAVRALLRSKLQALLTLSGMAVGVAMVVIVAGLARGAQLNIESQIERAGPTQITVRAGNFVPAAVFSSGSEDSGGGEVSQGTASDPINDARAGTVSTMPAGGRVRQPLPKHRTPAAPLSITELTLLRREIADVRAVAAGVAGNASVTDAAVPVSAIRLSGFEPTWPDMAEWRLAQGRWISSAEHAAGAPLALVTADVAARLWPKEESAVGRSLEVGGQSLHIVGIISHAVRTTDDSVLVVPVVNVPIALAQAILGRKDFDSITVRTTSVGVTTRVALQIRMALRRVHSLAADTMDDFRVDTQSASAMPGMGLDPGMQRAVHSNVVQFEQASWEETVRSLRQATRTFTVLLAAAAAVSLVVGGIGIMNIMLVSVTARTREIGLRMAMGATASNVTGQFLVEALTLAGLGGVGGVLLGSLGLLAVKIGLHWATSVSPLMLGLALGTAALTGTAFGLGPARRAAVLDPVIALRSE
jgi:putative ABC transport system permease protein